MNNISYVIDIIYIYKIQKIKIMENKYYIFFGNLSNKLKMDIVSELKKNPSSVLELAQKLHAEQSKLSHALASLRHCSIVNVKQEGKKRIYELNKETILPMLEIIDKHEHKFCKECRGKKIK
jgi:DNA-binding transcriptional ArsR family regulator